MPALPPRRCGGCTFFYERSPFYDDRYLLYPVGTGALRRHLREPQSSPSNPTDSYVCWIVGRDLVSRAGIEPATR